MDGLSRYQPHALGVLRIVTALLFIQHGTNKIFAWPDPEHGPGPFILVGRLGVGGILETFGGLSLLLGFYTRSVAFVLCGQMAVAFWWIHFTRGLSEGKPWGVLPVQNGGDLAILFCFVFLYFVFSGPGAWSIDGHIAKRPNPTLP